jgi:hypothetical protein
LSERCAALEGRGVTVLVALANPLVLDGLMIELLVVPVAMALDSVPVALSVVVGLSVVVAILSVLVLGNNSPCLLSSWSLRCMMPRREGNRGNWQPERTTKCTNAVYRFCRGTFLIV